MLVAMKTLAPGMMLVAVCGIGSTQEPLRSTGRAPRVGARPLRSLRLLQRRDRAVELLLMTRIGRRRSQFLQRVEMGGLQGVS